MTPQPPAGTLRTVGTARTLDDVQKAMRARYQELGVTLADLDAIAGFTDGHASKLLAPHPQKRLGRRSLQWLLQSMGLVLVVAVENETPNSRTARTVPPPMR